MKMYIGKNHAETCFEMAEDQNSYLKQEQNTTNEQTNKQKTKQNKTHTHKTQKQKRYAKLKSKTMKYNWN